MFVCPLHCLCVPPGLHAVCLPYHLRVLRRLARLPRQFLLDLAKVLREATGGMMCACYCLLTQPQVVILSSMPSPKFVHWHNVVFFKCLMALRKQANILEERQNDP